jgi:hypothetical protein
MRYINQSCLLCIISQTAFANKILTDLAMMITLIESRSYFGVPLASIKDFLDDPSEVTCPVLIDGFEHQNK